MALKIFFVIVTIAGVLASVEAQRFRAPTPAKRGSCPPPSFRVFSTSQCSSDTNCPGNLKCCATQAGAMLCTRPVTEALPATSRVGACPPPDKHAGAWVCSNTCLTDSDCAMKNHKCCENRCGARVCTEVSAAPPPRG